MTGLSITTRRGRLLRPRGGAVLETAVAMPFILLLTFGLIEYGHFLYLRHTMMGAARNGVRAAIVASSDNDTVAGTVEAAMSDAGLTPASYTVVTVPADLATAAKGDLITVTIEATWETVGLRPMKIIAASAVLRGSAVMRKEGP